MYIQGPEDYDLYTTPGTHFRHARVANVSFLDGHVDAMTRANVPFPSYWPPEAVELADNLEIGYVAETSVETVSAVLNRRQWRGRVAESAKPRSWLAGVPPLGGKK